MELAEEVKWFVIFLADLLHLRPLWSWKYDSWSYNNYLCNQCLLPITSVPTAYHLSAYCLSPLKLWVRIPLRWGVLDTTLCDKVCQWLAAGWWFFLVSSTNKTDRYDITEILLKVALNLIILTKDNYAKIEL